MRRILSLPPHCHPQEYRKIPHTYSDHLGPPQLQLVSDHPFHLISEGPSSLPHLDSRSLDRFPPLRPSVRPLAAVGWTRPPQTNATCVYRGGGGGGGGGGTGGGGRGKQSLSREDPLCWAEAGERRESPLLASSVIAGKKGRGGGNGQSA